jgi:hypothetical protein
MKQLFLLVLGNFLTGCAAPPPVKIASHLLGRTVLQEARDEMMDPDDVRSDD